MMQCTSKTSYTWVGCDDENQVRVWGFLKEQQTKRVVSSKDGRSMHYVAMRYSAFSCNSVAI